MTDDFRFVIPEEICEALELSREDMVVFEILEPGVVTMKKADGIDYEFTAALEQLLSEQWISGEDDEAYSSL
jgi:bifunctional DNA-binding transcriptional regulator/antitoxin component of YhaV-PrlF toxin-antitoxin module